jgi:phospholipid/cholesterol/gamma-HCH transport system permease protein
MGLALPLLSAMDTLGGIVLLTWRSLTCWLTPPWFSWWPEATDQAWILIKRCMLPTGISVFVFGYGPVGVEGGTFFKALGQIDRLGGLYSVGAVREYVPWVTGMVVAGVAGTAITADLGARRVRDELDALAVIGVDAIRALVAPRVLALTLVLPLLNLAGWCSPRWRGSSSKSPTTARSPATSRASRPASRRSTWSPTSPRPRPSGSLWRLSAATAA